MKTSKMKAGGTLPVVKVPTLNGEILNLFTPANDYDWRLVVVYRGKHCPICTRYLETLNKLLFKFHKLQIDVVAVSADSMENAIAHTKPLNLDFDVFCKLSIEQMEKLGLYISEPRSAEEASYPFSEPGLFLVNEHNTLQVIDISNAPFSRPELNSLLMGLGFIRNPENNYPIRGTFL